MRDYPFLIREALQQGLRPEREIVGGKQFLAECYNMKPAEGGLESYISPTDPFGGGISTDWPWPQIFFTSQGELLVCEEDDIKIAQGVGTTPWTTSSQTLADPDDPVTGLPPTINSVSIPSGGGIWHLIDNGYTWYLTKDNYVVFKTGMKRFETYGTTDPEYFGSGDPTFRTGTTHKGRTIIGGPNPAHMWPEEWTSIFSNFQQEAPSEIQFQDDEIDRNWVMWSSVGGGDIPFWFYNPDNFVTDVLISEDDLIKRLERNEMGWMSMPFEGPVYKTATLGEQLVVYGEEGIAVMALTGAQNIGGLEDPVPSTYGVRQLADFGVAGRGAVAEGDQAHFFVTPDGEGALLTAEGDVRRIGYREYLGNLPAQTLTSGYNPIEEEFYICSDTEGWVFNNQGLAEHRDHITGATAKNGTWYGLSHSPTTSDMEVISNTIDFNLQAAKRVQNIKAHARDIDNLTATLQLRYDHDDSYQDVGPIPFNKEGVAWLRGAGLEFRLKLTGNPNAFARLNRLSVRYQVSDKRGIRGPVPDAD